MISGMVTVNRKQALNSLKRLRDVSRLPNRIASLISHQADVVPHVISVA